MTAQIKSRLQNLESNLSTLAGVKVQITIRGERAFTYSFEGQNPMAEKAIRKYFKKIGSFTDGNGNSGYCPECELTCLFHQV
jgi:hypothetical protein